MLLMIDPSIRALGFALFRPHGYCYGYGTIKAHPTVEWVNRVDNSCDMIEHLCGCFQIDRALIEMPRHYSGGVAAEAAKNSGDILKLVFQVAALRSTLMSLKVGVELVPVEKWKGNVPKHITQQRIRRYWGFCPSDHNAADAVGLGDWWIRKINRLSPLRSTPYEITI